MLGHHVEDLSRVFGELSTLVEVETLQDRAVGPDEVRDPSRDPRFGELLARGPHGVVGRANRFPGVGEQGEGEVLGLGEGLLVFDRVERDADDVRAGVAGGRRWRTVQRWREAYLTLSKPGSLLLVAPHESTDAPDLPADEPWGGIPPAVGPRPQSRSSSSKG